MYVYAAMRTTYVLSPFLNDCLNFVWTHMYLQFYTFKLIHIHAYLDKAENQFEMDGVVEFCVFLFLQLRTPRTFIHGVT
jgi:hypothetical protein